MRKDKEKLEKILESINRIKEYTKEGEGKFFSDHLIQDGVLRNLQVIGQAIKDLSEELKQKNPDVDWRKASRMRDKVTHDYFDVNYDIVWDTVENSLPPFRNAIEDIYQRLIHKIPSDQQQSSKLAQKLKDK